MRGPRRTPLIVVVVIILFDHHADYRALAQQIEVPNRVRTSSSVFQDSVDFKAFRPSPSSPLSHSSSSSQFPYFWVPSKIEAQEAVPVPFQPTVDTQLSNEIEFHKSNELLVPAPYQPYNRHRIRYQERNRKRHRRKYRKQQQNQQNFRHRSGCDGTCKNMFSCMFSGKKVDWDNHGTCPGMMDSCCTKWDPSRRQKKYIKSGRSLGPFPQVQYTDSAIIVLDKPGLNNIQGSSPAVPKNPDVSYYTCGISKNAQRKIMGGLDAGYGQFPWTAHVKIKGPGIDKVCGGTLIDRKWVLTAGHCTQYCLTPDCSSEISQSDITYKVILGEYDMLSDEAYQPESYLVTYVFRHPEYRNVMRYRSNGMIESEPRFDVALMLLERPVSPAPNVAPICLPQNATTTLPEPGTLATVVGWGRLGREEGAPHSNVLQATTVPILSDYGCALQTGLGVYNDQLCAGGSYAETSACPGDSGGGLQIQDDQDRWTLIGIVSNGPSLCGAQPVIFHKVAHTLAWVRQTMHDWTYFSSHEQQTP